MAVDRLSRTVISAASLSARSCPPALAKLLDRVATLLDQRRDHLLRLGLVERAALWTFAIHQRGLGHAQGREPCLVPCSHRGCDVPADLRHERHAFYDPVTNSTGRRRSELIQAQPTSCESDNHAGGEQNAPSRARAYPHEQPTPSRAPDVQRPWRWPGSPPGSSACPPASGRRGRGRAAGRVPSRRGQRRAIARASPSRAVAAPQPASARTARRSTLSDIAAPIPACPAMPRPPASGAAAAVSVADPRQFCSVCVHEMRVVDHDGEQDRRDERKRAPRRRRSQRGSAAPPEQRPQPCRRNDGRESRTCWCGTETRARAPREQARRRARCSSLTRCRRHHGRRRARKPIARTRWSGCRRPGRRSPSGTR